MEQQENIEKDEELDKMDALNEENRQANLIKEGLEIEEKDAIAWRKRVFYFCGFCIVVILIIYFGRL